MLRVNVIERDVYIIGLLAHNHGVPLTERTTADILATDPHVEACVQARRKESSQTYRKTRQKTNEVIN